MSQDLNALDDEAFRRTVRDFFSQHYPEELRYPKRRLRWAEVKPWFMSLSDNGWAAPGWPVQFGGMGLAPDKLIAFIEEQEKWGVARTPDMGLTMVGPLLIRYGTEEQRAQYLPRILSGDHIWAQGYSEPNAGSDLASLRTEAVDDGADFIVNGQKTWATLAQDATHIFLLARTEKGVKKQEGISFLLVDAATPGISIRAIRNIAGNEDFCEIFFENVRVPQANLVGERTAGWKIAKALLTFERIFLGSPKQSQYALARVREAAALLGLSADAGFQDRLTQLELDAADLNALYARFVAQFKRGEALGAEVSMLKLWGTETFSRISDLLLEVTGSAGGLPGDIPAGEGAINALTSFYNARPATIYGGSSEVQRNILAAQVLSLPI